MGTQSAPWAGRQHGLTQPHLSCARTRLQSMLGATETSFGLLWATLVVLGARPDVQDKIREEQVGGRCVGPRSCSLAVQL